MPVEPPSSKAVLSGIAARQAADIAASEPSPGMVDQASRTRGNIKVRSLAILSIASGGVIAGIGRLCAKSPWTRDTKSTWNPFKAFVRDYGQSYLNLVANRSASGIDRSLALTAQKASFGGLLAPVGPGTTRLRELYDNALSRNHADVDPAETKDVSLSGLNKSRTKAATIMEHANAYVQVHKPSMEECLGSRNKETGSAIDAYASQKGLGKQREFLALPEKMLAKDPPATMGDLYRLSAMSGDVAQKEGYAAAAHVRSDAEDTFPELAQIRRLRDDIAIMQSEARSSGTHATQLLQASKRQLQELESQTLPRNRFESTALHARISFTAKAVRDRLVGDLAGFGRWLEYTTASLGGRAIPVTDQVEPRQRHEFYAAILDEVDERNMEKQEV